jgi:hypothetical protein
VATSASGISFISSFEVKKFLIQTGKFLLVVFLVLNATGWILLKFNLQGHAVENGFIYDSIAKARKSWPETEIFLLGDSVATQMYPPKEYSGRINSLSMVNPCTLAGQYFLLKRLAEGNELRGKKIILAITPATFGMDFSHKGTFHYVLKPFYNAEFSPWKEEAFKIRIIHKSVAMLSQLPIVRCSNWISPIPYLNEVQPNRTFISDINHEYLLKIKSLVEKEGGTLELKCTVQPESKRGTFEEKMKSDVEAMGLGKIFQGYLASAIYFPDSLFGSDKVHLDNPKAAPQNLLNL